MHNQIGMQYSVINSWYSAIGTSVATDIARDNILIVGSRVKWNHDIAQIIQRALIKENINSRIVTSNDFLIRNSKKSTFRNNNIVYIIICNSRHTKPEELAHLKDFCSTQILFKIEGLYLREIGSGIHVSNSAKAFTESLGIKQDNQVSLGLLASLRSREFCVVNSDHISKRRLSGDCDE